MPTWRHAPVSDIRAEGLARRAERRFVTNLVDDICQIYEGTNQIQRAVIAKKLLG